MVLSDIDGRSRPEAQFLPSCEELGDDGQTTKRLPAPSERGSGDCCGQASGGSTIIRGNAAPHAKHGDLEQAS
jgi:hypothetical protein